MNILKPQLCLALIAGTLIAASGGALLGYKYYKAEHQKKILANARTELTKGASAAAAFWVVEALKANPKGAEENRLMADLADAAKSPSVLQWRIRAVQLDPTNLNNYLAWANSELELGEPEMALEVLRQAPAGSKEDPGWQSLSAAAAAACGLVDEAESHFEEVARLKAADPFGEVNLETFRLCMPTKSDAAREWLRQRIKDPVVGLRVQRALLQDALRRDVPSDGEVAKSAIEQNPQSEIGDQINCLEIDYRKNSYAESLKRLQKSVEGRPDAAVPLIYWMLSHGLGREAMDWFETAFPAKSRPIPLQIAEADAISSLADWPLLAKTIAQTNWRGLDFVRRAMLIRVQKETGKSDWNVAWDALAKDLSADNQSVLMAARLIEGWGWLDNASELSWQLLRRSAPQRKGALELLTKIYGAEKDAYGLFRVTEAQLDIAQNNIGFRNNFACLALLLGLDTEKAAKLAMENAKLAPTEPKVLATYSFARLCQGRSTEARKILEALPPETLARPNIALYYAAVLFAEHDRDLALKFARIAMTSKQMLPQEEAIAKRILFSVAPEATP